MSELFLLNETEQRALAGLLYAVATADRVFTRAEAQTIAEIASQVGETSNAEGPYRDAAPPVVALDAADLFALIEAAAEEREAGDWVRVAEGMVTRPEARFAIYTLLYELATAELVSPPEQAILDHIKKAWDLP